MCEKHIFELDNTYTGLQKAISVRGTKGQFDLRWAGRELHAQQVTRLFVLLGNFHLKDVSRQRCQQPVE